MSNFQLPRAIQQSLNVESPPRTREYSSPHRARENSPHPRTRENGSGGDSYQIPLMFSSGFRTRAGCHSEIGHARFLSCMGAVWHPECFCCHACSQPIYMSSPCRETFHAIKLATRSAFTQNVMSASNL